MFRNIAVKLKQMEKRLDDSYGSDFSSPQARRNAWRHFQWLDHAILRVFWTNLAEVSPGVWRSNHPSPARVEKYKAMGINTILNLRGTNRRSHYMFEKEACDANGIELIALRLKARSLSDPQAYLDLLDLFESTEKPFLFHCKSGADRAGLAAALYLMHVQGTPVAEAKKQLSLRFIHFKSFKTGILDHMLDAYEADTMSEDIPIRDWISTRFDPVALTREFDTARGLSGPQ